MLQLRINGYLEIETFDFNELRASELQARIMFQLIGAREVNATLKVSV